jgi:hypothetical protein
MDRSVRTLMFPLLVALVATGACGTLPASTTHAAAFGTPQTYATGETRAFDDGLAVTLVRIDDSRCKADVQCIWAGELAPVLTLRGGSLDATQSVSLGTSRTTRAQVGDYGLLIDSATESTATITITRGPVDRNQ